MRATLLVFGTIAAALLVPGAGAYQAGSNCSSYIVVGAGMAGLGAAERLLQLNPRAAVTVVEARDRVGGRVYTDLGSLGPGGKFDVGASWIHTSGPSNPITQLASRHGSVVGEDADEPNFLVDGGVGRAHDEWPEDSQIAAWAARGNVPASTVWGAFGDTPDGLLFRSRADFDTAAGDTEWSVARFERDGADGYGEGELVFRDGYGTVPGNLSAALRVMGVTFLLESPVRDVSHADTPCGGVNVTLRSGAVLRAGAAIVTVPLGVLQGDSISFWPRLPPTMAAAIGRMRMGRHGKAAIRFETDFWTPVIGRDRFAFNVRVPNAADAARRGAGPTWFNLNKYNGVPVLMCFLSGDYGTALGSKSDTEVLNDLLATLRQAFGASAVSRVTHFTRSRWESDPYANGSYTNFGSIHHQDGDYGRLAQPASATLSLAGEHTHAQYFSSVHGAYLSGQRAAEAHSAPPFGDDAPSAAGAHALRLLLLVFISFVMLT